MKHRRIFHDQEGEKQFRTQGYFTRQLLSDADISYLLEVFKSLNPRIEKEFYSTIDSTDLDYRRQVDERIGKRISDIVTAYFINYSPLIFNFIVKEPGGDSEVFMHMDDTHVDETRYQSVNVWCPLVDTTPANGALFVMPGSHTLAYPPRGFGIPYPYSEFHELVKPRMEMVPLKAGEAIFYNNKLMHRSDPNHSNASRPAIIMAMLPDEADRIIHFHMPDMPENKVEVFELSKEFYLNFDRNKRPEGFKSLGMVDYKRVKPSREEFIRILDRVENVDLLTAGQLASLERLYTQEQFPPTGDFYLTIWRDAPEHRLMVHDHIQEIVSPAFRGLLYNYKPIISSYAVKRSSTDSAWHPHQDDTFVDEKNFVSLSIWVPLIDTHAGNGALMVWPGSHMLYTGPRSPNIPQPFKDELYSITAHLIDVNVKAGQAVIFDHRLVHASRMNVSGTDRLAVVTVLIPEEASLLYIYLDKSHKPEMIRQYEISERYYLESPLGEYSTEPDPEKFRLLATYPYIETNTIPK
ncbi:unnamed protein product [Sphagnum jensenii]|uniref:Phytanoyl-CoA dioxygenase n=1 Tax=Sphagnum jensenii TaxID=128206 RepID=A0ABP0V666_9BRYO